MNDFKLPEPSRPALPNRRIPGSGLQHGPRKATTSPGPKINVSTAAIPTAVADKWRHILVMILAISVAVIGFDSSSRQGSAAASTGDESTPRVAQANILPAVTLPTIKSLELPPIPERNDGVNEPYIAAENVILIDEASKTVLYEKDADVQVPIASTTKIATAVVSLEHYKDLDERVTISQAAATQIGSAVGFRVGETATIRELLHGLLMVSGNDAAFALAEHMAKSGDNDTTSRFVNEMNKMARTVGATNTRFADPAGLNDIEGHSTAHDMAKIKMRALSFDLYRQIAGKLAYEYTSPERYRHTFENSNWLLKAGSGFEYPYVETGKTGYTPKLADGTGAGHCLITSALHDGHRLVAVVFDTYEHTAQASAKVSKTLYEYGYSAFTWKPIVR